MPELKEYLQKASISSGLSWSCIEMEFYLMNFLDRLFRSDLPVVLFGGTALNKLYFLDRQRFSKDIDVDFNGRIDIGDIDTELRKIFKEYAVSRVATSPRGIFEGWKVHFGKEKGQEIAIEVSKVKSLVTETPRKTACHSVLEYEGMPILPVEVSSYSFEYLIARKFSALGRRYTGKDIYDIYQSSKIQYDKKKMKGYLKKIIAAEKIDFDYFVHHTLYWLRKLAPASSSISNVEETIPLRNRESLQTMINTCKLEFEKLLI